MVDKSGAMTGSHSEYYGGHAASYNAIRLDGEDEIRLTTSIFSAHLTPPARVIEVGCGTARYGAALQAAGFDVTGLDVSEDQLAHAAGVARVVHASATDMPFQDGAFDGAMAVLMIHQLDADERRRMLAESRRILRDGGVLMIKTCTEDDLRARWVENFFPSALPFNMRRYPVIEQLEAEFVAEGFALRSIIRSRTLPVISTSSLLVSVKARHNTTLASLSSAEFEDGYERLRQCLSEKDAVVVPQAHTHIVVTNDSSNEVRTSADVLGSAETRSQRRVAADVAVIRGRETLLVKRAFPPDAGAWAIPGGYVERDESVEAAAARELWEETALTLTWCELVAVHSAPERHPDQLITVLFVGDGNGDVRAGDDALEARWFPLDRLPEYMALDHRTGIAKAAAVAASRQPAP
jgi:8-oxo-dGTP diphosphatase